MNIRPSAAKASFSSLLVLATALSCSDPAGVNEQLRVEISGPGSVEARVLGEPPDLFYECRFDLTARVLGGRTGDEVWINSPTVALQLASGGSQGYNMLSGWEKDWAHPGDEVRGSFYLSAREPFDAVLRSNWLWTYNNEWMDDQRVQYGNYFTLSCR